MTALFTSLSSRDQSSGIHGWNVGPAHPSVRPHCGNVDIPQRGRAPPPWPSGSVASHPTGQWASEIGWLRWVGKGPIWLPSSQRAEVILQMIPVLPWRSVGFSMGIRCGKEPQSRGKRPIPPVSAGASIMGISRVRCAALEFADAVAIAVCRCRCGQRPKLGCGQGPIARSHGTAAELLQRKMSHCDRNSYLPNRDLGWFSAPDRARARARLLIFRSPTKKG